MKGSLDLELFKEIFEEGMKEQEMAADGYFVNPSIVEIMEEFGNSLSVFYEFKAIEFIAGSLVLEKLRNIEIHTNIGGIVGIYNLDFGREINVNHADRVRALYYLLNTDGASYRVDKDKHPSKYKIGDLEIILVEKH